MDFENKQTIHRFIGIAVALTLFGVAIIGTAIYETLTKEQYWEIVRKRLIMQQKEIPARRGNIYAADGQLLVGTMPVYTLRLDYVIQDKNDSIGAAKMQVWRDSAFKADLDSLSLGLHEIFPKTSAAAFKANLSKGFQKKKHTWLIQRNVSYINYLKVLKLPFIRHGQQRSGFYVEELPRRQKPFGSLANRTLGTLVTQEGCDSAQSGLEFSFDTYLRGINGKKHREKVRHMWMDKTDIEPVDGMDVITTLDVDFQDEAEKLLRAKLQEIDAEVGVVVLMEVATGDIKAISNLTRLSPGVYAEVKNNAVTDLWEPGSTFKTAAIMVALEDKKITINDWVDVGKGVYNMHGRLMKDHNWHRGGYNRAISVPECLMFSSNVGVSKLIDQYYHDCPEKFVDGLYREGVGVPMKLPFSGAGKPRVRRPLPDKRNWSKTALAWMSIGYETQIPPIYTVTFYNAIANNGKMVKPRFVKEIQKNGQTVQEFPVEVVKPQICSPSTLKDIQTILERVVNDKTGTGKRAGCKQFHVSGKTGTAQVADEHGSYRTQPARHMVSFCGYYPSDNPQYSCIVCIKHAHGGASGGGQAGPVFSELAQFVMTKSHHREAEAAADSASKFVPAALPGDAKKAKAVFEDLGIQGYHLTEKVPQSLIKKCESIPDVTGLGVRDAVSILEQLGMQVRVHGQGIVKHQSLPAGHELTQDSVIVLELQKK